MLESFAVKESEKLSYPKNEGCAEETNPPVGECQWNNCKEISTKLNYKYLSTHNNQANQKKFSAVFKLQCTSAGCISPCVKHIPKLHEHEYREEKRHFIFA